MEVHAQFREVVTAAVDTAIIGQANLTVKHAAQDTSILALTSAAALDLSGGSLTLTSGASSISVGQLPANLTTWLGEHQNESDMAFYSTFPFDHLVGPGIGRAEYGGFLMTLPPRSLMDVWTDADYEFAQNKPERLLMAALERHKEYPLSARTRRAEGTVVLRFAMRRDGSVASWSIARSSGHEDLDQAVATMIRRASP